MSRPQYGVGQIIRDWGADSLSRFPVKSHVARSFARMAVCRTKYLGGHVEACPECGEMHVSYNSCRDRHCPKCQNKERAVWVEMRKDEVTPRAKYFHVVFTVPDCLHTLSMSHQELFYSAMFRAAWNTLCKFFAEQSGKAERYKARGIQGGMTCILHTWGGSLYYHPHVQCIVTGGGVDADGVWHHLDSCRDSRDFLFPVQALSKVFRAKLTAMLTFRLGKAGQEIPGDVRKKCFEKAWVGYSRPPAKGVNQVLEYIGRYAYRVAISNSRILGYTADGLVTYDYKDYRHNGVHRQMTMHAVDFLHLFSLHVLPPAFVRIRHYGLLSPSNRDRLRSVQEQIGGTPVPKQRRKKTYQEVCQQKGWDVGICPHCRCRMVVTGTIEPARAPTLSSYRRAASA